METNKQTVEEKITAEEFRELIDNAETIKDGERAVEQLTNEQLIEAIEVFDKAIKWCGLTMRDEFVLVQMKSERNRRLN